MHRIQVQLTPEQERMLRELATLRGKSVSALIREGVDRLLKPEKENREELWRRASSFIGSGHDFEGATDVSERHDDYLVEAILHSKAPLKE